MNMKEWEEKEMQRTYHSEEAKIVQKFIRNEMPITAKEKEILKSYIKEGERRQELVAEQAEIIMKKQKRKLKNIAGSLMYMEPYVVFYKRHIMREITDFEIIDYWVEKVQKWIEEAPPYQEQVLYAERMY